MIGICEANYFIWNHANPNKPNWFHLCLLKSLQKNVFKDLRCQMQGLNHFLRQHVAGLMLEMLPMHMFLPLKPLLQVEDIVWLKDVQMPLRSSRFCMSITQLTNFLISKSCFPCLGLYRLLLMALYTSKMYHIFLYSLLKDTKS